MTHIMFLLRVLVLALIPVNAFGETGNPEAIVLLEVEFLNADGQDNTPVRYTMDDLRAMPAVSFETDTNWNAGPQRFTGVSLAALMRKLGVTTGTLVAVGSDEYSIDINLSFAAESEARTAYERTGAPMTVRNKGPFQVVYPFDDFSNLKRNVQFSNAKWQLVRIVMIPDN